MYRVRVAFGALVCALALAGCSSAPSATWRTPSGDVGVTGQAGTGQIGDDPQARPIGNGSSTAASPSPSASAPASPSASATASPALSASTESSDGITRKTGGQAVALTFDDGPSADTPRLLAMLREHGIKATFCVVGVAVQEFPQYLQDIAKDGHTLCNHTWKHNDQLGKRAADAIREDLQRTNDEIRRVVPDAQIKYFRHPGGNFTPAAVQVAKELGMVSLGWTVDPSDWNVKKYPGDKMCPHIIASVRNNTKPGGIVLSHDGGGDRSATIAAYKTLLPELKQQFTLIAMPN